MAQAQKKHEHSKEFFFIIRKLEVNVGDTLVTVLFDTLVYKELVFSFAKINSEL